MKRRGIIALLILSTLCTGIIAPVVAADSPPQPDLDFEMLNISGDEFVVIENVGMADADLAGFWLGHSSDSAQVAAPEQQLPSAALSPSQTILLQSAPQATCGASYSGKLNFSLDNSNGRLDLWQLASPAGQPASFSLVRSLSWDKSSTSAQLDPSREGAVKDYISDQKIDLVPPITWFHNASEPAVWQVGLLNNCVFTPVAPAGTGSGAETGPPETIVWQSAAAAPPYQVVAPVSLKVTPSDQPHVPSADLGLKAVQISEILPNPASPETDADDEFVELFNPNSQTFDLSDFVVQIVSATSGSNSSYHIPPGTKISPDGFINFSSADTSISLNNDGGQVWLVDPQGNTVDKSDAYGKADDGQSWIKTDKGWQWTSLPTPGESNKLAVILGAQSAGSDGPKPDFSRQVDSPATAVKADKTNQPSAKSSAASVSSDEQPVAVHSSVLAIVILLAVFYGAYEYRHDLSNKFHQFRSYRAIRRANRG